MFVSDRNVQEKCLSTYELVFCPCAHWQSPYLEEALLPAHLGINDKTEVQTKFKKSFFHHPVFILFKYLNIHKNVCVSLSLLSIMLTG